MTYREWMQEHHPDDVQANYGGGVKGCPDEYIPELSCDDGLCMEKRPIPVSEDERCRLCWDREMPETKEEEERDGKQCNYNGDDMRDPDSAVHDREKKVEYEYFVSWRGTKRFAKALGNSIATTTAKLDSCGAVRALEHAIAKSQGFHNVVLLSITLLREVPADE